MNRKIYASELKKIQIEILNAVDSFCRNNNINYWIDTGTLLGAIRHKGYIPWDDDIDIGMLREDYDYFTNTFNNSNTRYQFHCPENDEKFAYAHGKVYDTNTILYEPDKNGICLCVNIDVFVYDNAPDNDDEVKSMYKRRDYFRMLNVAHSFGHDIVGGAIRNIGFAVLKFLTFPFPKNYFALKMAKNSKKYSKYETERVGNFTSYSKIVCDKRLFESFIEVSFEGGLYKAPVGYDKWLKAFYGDYMKLPPIEKRVSHHVFEAYIEE